MLVCGRRWGKSKLLVLLALSEALRPRSIIWPVAPTYELTKRVYRPLVFIFRHVLPVRFAQLGMRAPRIVRDVDSSSERMFELDTGTLVQAKSAENPDSLLGEGVNFAPVDEFARVSERVIEENLLPTLLDTNGRMAGATTPRGFDYAYKCFLKGQPGTEHDPDWRSVQSPTWENTALPATVCESFQRNLSSVGYEQEIGARFTVRAGRCFGEFSRAVHASRPVPRDPMLPIRLLIDFGYRTFAMAGAQDEKSTQTTRIFEEGEWHEITTGQAIARIKEWFDWWPEIAYIDCDPAGDGTNIQTRMSDVQLFRRAFPAARIRFSTQPDHRNPENRAEWIRARIRSEAGEVRLFVDPHCTSVIRMFEQSIYPEHKEGQAQKNEPLKDGVNDHLRDAIGYGEVCQYRMGVTGAVARRA